MVSDREDWLTLTGALIRRFVFDAHGIVLPAVIEYRSDERPDYPPQRQGCCRSGKWGTVVWINPAIDNDLIAACTIIHELTHASLPPHVDHGEEFINRREQLGLTEWGNSAVIGDQLLAELRKILATVGDLPRQ